MSEYAPIRVRWEQVNKNNPNCAYLHLSKTVPNVVDAGRSETWLSEATEEEKEFIRSIASIPGVEKVSGERYKITIHAGRVFYWHEIIPTVYTILKNAFGGEIELINGPDIDEINERELRGDWEVLNSSHSFGDPAPTEQPIDIRQMMVAPQWLRETTEEDENALFERMEEADYEDWGSYDSYDDDWEDV